MTETLQLPFGYATMELTPPITVSDWRQGVSHRRARGPQSPRRWQVRWDGVAMGARLYLEQLLSGVQGSVIEWTPPNNSDNAVRARITSLRSEMATAQNHTISAELEEAVEPC